MQDAKGEEPAALLARSRRALVEGDFGVVFESARLIDAIPSADAALQAQACLIAGMAAWNTGRAAEGHVWTDRAAARAREARDDSVLVQAVAVRGACLALQERVGEAVGALREAMSLMREDMPVPVRRTVHTAVGVSCRQLGLSRLELTAARHVLDSLETDAPAFGVIRSWCNFANAVEERWRDLAPVDPAQAAALVDEALAELPRLQSLATGHPHARATVQGVFGCLLSVSGHLSEARECLREALQLYGGIYPSADGWQEALAMQVALARCARGLGDTEEADRALQEAKAQHALHHDLRTWTWLLRRLADMAELDGDPALAMKWARRHHAQVLRNEQAAVDAEVASLAVSVNQHVLAREVRQWRDLARHDALTGLLNRGALELEFAAMAGQRKVLGLFDVDHFKRINDRHGHLVGDAVLRTVAGLLASTLRQVDRVARFGGEEFVVLLVDMDAPGAEALSRRLQQRLREHDWAEVPDGLGPTLSGGLVAMESDEDFEQAISRADALLYEAKGQGRDRILVEPRRR